MTDLFVWAAERARQHAIRAYRLAPHGQRRSRARALIWATAAALRVEAHG